MKHFLPTVLMLVCLFKMDAFNAYNLTNDTERIIYNELLPNNNMCHFVDAAISTKGLEELNTYTVLSSCALTFNNLDDLLLASNGDFSSLVIGDVICTTQEDFKYQFVNTVSDIEVDGIYLMALPNNNGFITTSQLNWGDLSWDEKADQVNQRTQGFNLLFDANYEVKLAGTTMKFPANSTIDALKPREDGLTINLTVPDRAPGNGVIWVNEKSYVSNLLVEDTHQNTDGNSGPLFYVKGDNVKFFNVALSAQYNHQITLTAGSNNFTLSDSYIGDGMWRLYILQNPTALTYNTVIENVYFDRGYIDNSEHIKIGGVNGRISGCTFFEAHRDGIDTTQGLQNYVIENCEFINNGQTVGFGGIQLKSVTGDPPQPENFVRNDGVIIRDCKFTNSQLQIYSGLGDIENPTYQTAIELGIRNVTLENLEFEYTANSSNLNSRLTFMNAYNINGNNLRFKDCVAPINAVGSTGMIFAAEHLNLTNIDVEFNNQSTWVMSDFQNSSFHFSRAYASPIMTAGTQLLLFSNKNDNVEISGNFEDFSASSRRAIFIYPHDETNIIFKDLNVITNRGSAEALFDKGGFTINNTNAASNGSLQFENCSFNNVNAGVEFIGSTAHRTALIQACNIEDSKGLIKLNHGATQTNLTIANNTGTNANLFSSNPYHNNTNHVLYGSGNGNFNATQAIVFGYVYYNGDVNLGLIPESGNTDALNNLYGGIKDTDIVTLSIVNAGDEITVTDYGNITLLDSGVTPNRRYINSGNSLSLRFNKTTKKWEEIDSAVDNVAPVLALNGLATINLTVGDSYIEQGATATDHVDGDLSASVVISGDSVDIHTVGTYVVTYNVSDTAGNAAAQITRTVEISPLDTKPPVITLIGYPIVNLELGNTYTEFSASAIDDIDGDTSASIVISGDTVDTHTPGTYVVTYNVSDAAGNAASEVSRTITISPDLTRPNIVLNGLATMTLEVGDAYIELGGTAIDDVDGDISANIAIAGDIVDTNTVGAYAVTYNVSDVSGNVAQQVTRMVSVTLPLSVKENSLRKDEIKLYPNPTKKRLTLQLKSKDITAVQVFNLRGSLLLNEAVSIDQNSNEFQLDTSNFEAGIYFIEVIDSAQNSNFLKFIKQ